MLPCEFFLFTLGWLHPLRSYSANTWPFPWKYCCINKRSVLNHINAALRQFIRWFYRTCASSPPTRDTIHRCAQFLLTFICVLLAYIYNKCATNTIVLYRSLFLMYINKCVGLHIFYTNIFFSSLNSFVPHTRFSLLYDKLHVIYTSTYVFFLSHCNAYHILVSLRACADIKKTYIYFIADIFIFYPAASFENFTSR